MIGESVGWISASNSEVERAVRRDKVQRGGASETFGRGGWLGLVGMNGPQDVGDDEGVANRVIRVRRPGHN